MSWPLLQTGRIHEIGLAIGARDPNSQGIVLNVLPIIYYWLPSASLLPQTPNYSVINLFTPPLPIPVTPTSTFSVVNFLTTIKHEFLPQLTKGANIVVAVQVTGSTTPIPIAIDFMTSFALLENVKKH